MSCTIMDEKSAAGSINRVLAGKVGPQKWRVWFRNSTRITVASGCVKVAVPNSFIAGWIEKRFAGHIAGAALEVTGTEHRVAFSIDPQLGHRQKKRQQDVAVEPVRKTVLSEKKPAQSRGLKLSLDSFVVGPSNQLAFNAAKAVVTEKSPFNPLFLHGGYGIGKTHLLQGICNAMGKNHPGTRWLYLSAEEFANEFILALKSRKLEAFRRRMRQTDLLAIDDIHFLASKPSTQEEFLHTFNTIDLAGKQIVLASDAHPKMIGQLSEKLVNRFVSGMVVKINLPDVQTRRRICAKYALKLNRSIPGQVIDYIAESMQTNVRELEGAMIKLTAFSSLQGVPISLALARTVLAEQMTRAETVLSIADIEAAVGSYFAVSAGQLRSAKKGRTVALARNMTMYLARKHTRMSFPEIGRAMGKNHSTVIQACKRIESLLCRNAGLRWASAEGNRLSAASAVVAELESVLL